MKTLYKFKNFIDQINIENSRNYKISILEKYKDDEDIKYYLDFVFNPYIITGISDKKLNRKVAIDYTTQLNGIIDILNYAKTHNTGSDKDLSIIFTNRDSLFEYFDFNTLIVKDVSEDEYSDMISSMYNLFDNILIKNLQFGVDIKTINKIIPNLIPEFTVMLANKYFEKPEYVEGKEFAITTKIDGMRCIMFKKDGNVSFYSRQGQPIEGLVDLIEEAKKFIPDGIVLDGELVASISSKNIYKETMKLARTKDKEKHGLKMLVFDCMTVEEFENQQCNTAYNKRRDMLGRTFLHNIDGNQFISFVNKAYIFGLNDCVDSEQLEQLYRMHISDFVNSGGYTYFNILPILYQGTDTNKIIELLNEQTANGEEGIMINICDAPYEFKRTWNLLKVKKFNSCDLRVLELECGTNKNSDKLGAFICEYKSGNKVKVGSGISEEQRIEVWNNQDKYIGSIIEVSYFEETKNQNDGVSLRFPTFKDFRPDKSEPNY